MGVEQIEIPVADGVTLVAWHAPANMALSCALRVAPAPAPVDAALHMGAMGNKCGEVT
jgi:hypothetical protein